jgi:signal transduction histidine kinase
MVKPTLKYFPILIVGIICIVAAYFSAYYTTSQYNHSLAVQREITSVLQKKIPDLEATCKLVKKSLQEDENLSFSRLNNFSNCTFFIYKNDKPVYWSSNNLLPENINYLSNESLQFINYKGNLMLGYSIEYSNTQRDQFKIFSILPLYTKYNISNRYLQSKLNQSIFSNHSNITIGAAGSLPSPILIDGKEIFSIYISDSESQNSRFSIFYKATLYFGLFLILLFGVLNLKNSFLKKKFNTQIFFTLLLLVALRGLALLWEFPYEYFPSNLFDSRNFASSFISPSIGDYLINTILFAFIGFVLFYYAPRFKSLKLLLQSNSIVRFGLATIIVAATHAMLALSFSTFQSINFHSQWIFDVSTSIDFNYFRIVSLISFLWVVVGCFFFNHVLLQVLRKICPKSPFLLIATLLAGVVLSLLVFWKDKNFHPLILFIYSFYLLVHLRIKLGTQFYRLDNRNYLYLITQAIIFSLVGAVSIYTINQERLYLSKNKFAYSQLQDRDVLEEYMLADAQKKIEDDLYIQNLLSSPLSKHQNVALKIKKSHLYNYIEKYDVRITTYDNQGEPHNKEENQSSYNEQIKDLARKKYASEYKNLFFIGNALQAGKPKYVLFHKINRNKENVGFVLIRLFNKRYIPYSVFPQLLIDGRNLKENKSNYNYAVYHNQVLLTNYGSFNYEKDFKLASLNDPKIYTDGLIIKGFHHWCFFDKNSQNTIVVSDKEYHLKSILSNFSFLFIVLLLVILSILFVRRLYFRHQQRESSFSSKIQLILNTAFFLPLLVITATTLSIIGKLYEKNLEERFKNESVKLSNRMVRYLEEFESSSKKQSLQNFVSELATFTETDINFYNIYGKLLATSQQSIYKQNLISEYIHPEAFAEIKEQKLLNTLHNETIGNLGYHSVYMAVKSYNSGALLGIISIPFFESALELEQQLIEVFCTIINIFTIMFLIFLGLLQTLSQKLLIPLKILTQGLKSTSLSDSNKPIAWNSKDEIGLLVNEYNLMIKKLEISKIEIQNNEKEKAWRDIAKQVAHEIKNPLTPMKLTIQHLQMQATDSSQVFLGKVKKGFDTILNQIEILSNIAGSFSDFAKMPVPQVEPIELEKVLHDTVQLFMNQGYNGIQLQIPAHKIKVMSDSKVLSGILLNLLINAYQSQSELRNIKIVVGVKIVNDKTIISIQDNGIGIPTELRDSVFLPKFSTKSTGSGIGLALAKQGIEFMGGKIWFDSELNVGSTFYIELKNQIPTSFDKNH